MINNYSVTIMNSIYRKIIDHFLFLRQIDTRGCSIKIIPNVNVELFFRTENICLLFERSRFSWIARKTDSNIRFVSSCRSSRDHKTAVLVSDSTWPKPAKNARRPRR